MSTAHLRPSAIFAVWNRLLPGVDNYCDIVYRPIRKSKSSVDAVGKLRKIGIDYIQPGDPQQSAHLELSK